MKKYLRVFALLGAAAVCAGLASCKNAGKSTLLGSPAKVTSFTYSESKTDGFIALNESAESFADAFTARAVAEYGGDNLVVSPISVYSALAMAAECADGSTREEILSAMSVDYELLRSEFLNLYRSVLKETDTAKIKLINSVWVNESVPIKSTGVEALSEGYGAYSYYADFTNDNEAANLAVQHFVKEQTNGLIDADFDLAKNTYFALINTLYFKDNWNLDGSKLSLTDERYSFKNSDGSTTETNLMNGYYNSVRAYEGENFTSCYTTTYSGYRLMFIVPKDGFEVADVMTEENLAEAKGADYSGFDDENMVSYHTRCVFPAFTAESDLKIKGILQDMGIEELFDKDNGADLSNMFDTEDDTVLYSPEVTHIAKLEVDRRGIEGAAVTVIPANGESGAPDLEYMDVYLDFLVDRAFGFVITNNYGTTLFAGTVNAV